MKDITDEFRLTMDSVAKKAFFVHMPNKIVVFKQLENNLYGMVRDFASYISRKNYTVEDNLKFMPKQQQKRSNATGKAYQAIDTPIAQDFISMIRMNLTRDVKITTAYIDLAEKTFGPDIGAIEGKTTRRNPSQAVSNRIKIPP